jgi:hypothetical protein
MKRQGKAVIDHNYQTAGQPYESMPHSDRTVSEEPTFTEVKKEGAEDERATLEVVPRGDEDATPEKRRLHPMWVIIPLVVAVLLTAVIWGGAYLIEVLAGLKGE